ncbi:MAG: thermonuclease family protein [Ignavibacteria bacterium]|nr:thermonuclease family protein [Ignavibacteria bacterium]
MRKFIIIIPVVFLLFFQPLYPQPLDSTYIIGDFKITKITDGDTFKFEGLDRSTRLLGVDTEETFKDTYAQQKSFELSLIWPEEYYRLQSESKTYFPIKPESPFGFETWQWTKDFVEDVISVRLEKEDTLRLIDSYGRYLSYVILKFEDSEVNYNIECVRQGYSPYYNKYGNSKRFHKEFLEAQEYARDNKLGIWNSETKCYPDYEKRIFWWNKRAEQIKEYEKQYANSENSFNLMNDGEYDRLKNFVDKNVLVFVNITEINTDKNPSIIRTNIRRGVDFDIVFFDNYRKILDEYDTEMLKEFFLFASGKLSTYRDRYQIIVENPNQIWTVIEIK